MPNYLGIDLAWGEGTPTKRAKETGLVALSETGTILEAGWARGIPAVAEWIIDIARPGDVIAIDAPLVVNNATGMRQCEREVAQSYGRWKVAANATNLTRAWIGGVTLRTALEEVGFLYTGGAPAQPDAVTFFECYPYTTLVGIPELGYDVERPRYKRFDKSLANVTEKRLYRASECDELLRRLAQLTNSDVPLDLASHPTTATLLEEPSPTSDVPYKHREDLIDAALSAWTAAQWHRFGEARCQILGATDQPDSEGRVPAIIAPARESQRRDRPEMHLSE